MKEIKRDAISDEEVISAVTRRLVAQVGDPAAAARLAQYLFDVALTWRPPTIPVASIDSIIAYSLGFIDREDPTLEPLPGPINEQLADCMAKLVAAAPRAKRYAQWEVARVLDSKYGMKDVVSLERLYTDKGEMIYLSTAGVTDQILEREGGPAALGKTAVIGHHDHAWRCWDVCKRRGIDAYAAEGLQLPTDYDPRSGQNFTRNADVWQIYDLAIRIGDQRRRLIGA
ncbi:MAG: hypothetical protein WDO68_18125 [Gammaproteobacteria bacterium]